MRHTVHGEPNDLTHPVDQLRDFGYRFDVLRELAFAYICSDDMPEPLEETFAHGINELYEDFKEVHEAVKAWTARQSSDGEMRVAP